MEFFEQNKDALLVSLLSILFVACFEGALVFLSHFPPVTP